jgi:hypothetical protein
MEITTDHINELVQSGDVGEIKRLIASGDVVKDGVTLYPKCLHEKAVAAIAQAEHYGRKEQTYKILL